MVNTYVVDKNARRAEIVVRQNILAQYGKMSSKGSLTGHACVSVHNIKIVFEAMFLLSPREQQKRRKKTKYSQYVLNISIEPRSKIQAQGSEMQLPRATRLNQHKSQLLHKRKSMPGGADIS